MEIFDIVIFICIFGFVLAIFYISNREIQKSVKLTKKSEKILEQERLSLMEKIDEKTKQLKKSEDSRMNELSKMAEFGRLSQGLFHDLITPLSSVILHTEKLKNIPKEELETTEKTLEKAITASRQMAGYIQNIRSAMQGEREKQECDLRNELDDTIDFLSYRIRTENIYIHTDTENITWHGDAIKIRQVFSNLISNAIDSFEGIADGRKKEIEIKLYTTDSKINLEIKDNGSGISKENIDKIFNPFFTTKTPEKGTGIGLTTVKSIVENDLHGKIKVESEENIGTTFKIEFQKKLEHV